MRISSILLTWLLLSVAVLASAAAKELPCTPEQWQNEIAEFERADAKQAPAQQGILFVGSSSIRKWDLPKYFPELRPINRGFGGSEICDSVHFAEQLILKHRPSAVVLYAGDNDIARGKSSAQVHRDFLAFWKQIHGALPETQLIYIAIKPSLARKQLAPIMQAANARIAADCKVNKQLTFVDIWPPMLDEGGQPRQELFVADGLHLSAKGYELWTALVKQHLPVTSKK